MPNNNIQPLLTPSVLKILNDCLYNYTQACLHTDWAEREIYKFEFAEWLSSRVDFTKQSDDEIFDICSQSQKQQYSGSKGVNFLLSAGRNQRSVYITLADIQLFRKIAQGNMLDAADLQKRGISFTGLTGWLGTLFPERYVPIVALEEVDAICEIWSISKSPRKGYNSFFFNQPYGYALVAFIQEYGKETTDLYLKKLGLSSATTIFYNWLAQDFTIYIKRQLINTNNFPPVMPVPPKPTHLYPLNTILYGPPGTGKTYNTRQLAIQVIEQITEEELQKKYTTRESINNQFAVYRERNQVQFVTFHQSFSYEDFIEGIKPVLTSSQVSEGEENLSTITGEIAYELSSGIFKNICERAKSYAEYIPVPKTNHFHNVINQAFDKSNFYKMSIGNSALAEDEVIMQYCLQHDCIALGYGGDIDFTQAKDRSSIKKLLGLKDNERSTYEVTAVKTFLFDMQEGDFVFVSSGNFKIRAIAQISSFYYFQETSSISFKHFRKVKWLIKDINLPVAEVYSKEFMMKTIYYLNKNFIKQKYFDSKPIEEKSTEFRENYVLIIDEINRGNVSQIFGELITLIEEDKRLGKSEALEVTLPYSKEKFGVPANLHIIGTMNTADRSVEALDTALRRRFSFTEMAPMYDLPDLQKQVGSYKLSDILNKINRRLEKLLSKDHLIGHSYFLEVTDATNLRAAFQKKIIPLLQEYFYGDFGKIGLVLGHGFVELVEENSVSLFADFGSYEADALAEKEVYRLINFLEADDNGFIKSDSDFSVALDALMK